MPDLGSILERESRSVEAPEPSMDRLLRRRERRLRNQRIVAGGVALAVAAIGIGWSLVGIRFGDARQPASGGRMSPPAPSDHGWLSVVLPTVAIWIGVALLGLTVLLVTRRRRRTVQAFASREASGVGATPGHGPVTDTGTTGSEGVSEMDSKHRTGVGAPRTEIPAIRLESGKARRTNRWLVGAVVVLALAVVTLGVALIVQDNSGKTPKAASTPGLADRATVALVDGFVAANNSGDVGAIADQYLPDGVLYGAGDYDLQPPRRFATNQGRSAIQRFYQWLSGQTLSLSVERVGPVLQAGDMVTFMVHDYNGLDHTWVQVWRDGKIAKQWIVLPGQ